MKRTMIMVFALLVLAISQASVAFARETELSDIARPATATATLYPQYSMPAQVALSQAVTEPQRLSEVFRFESR